MSIVVGMAIDKDPVTDRLLISNEIVDLTRPNKEGGAGSKIVESQGKTLFDAVRNAKMRLLNRLYYGNMQVMVLSEEIARRDGLSGAIDWVMRDAEGRETLLLVIAQATSANGLLSTKGTDQNILSLEIDRILAEDARTTASTTLVELYTIYDILNGDGKSLTLPAFSLALNQGEQTIQANGIAIFNDDKLAGFLTPEQSKFFLLATGEAQGGILPLTVGRGASKPDTSLEIASNKANTSFFYRGDRLTFRIETQTDVYLAETMADIDVLDAGQINALEELAKKRLELEISSVIKLIQTETGSDILGFGRMIHKHDHPLWVKLKDDWDSIFPTLDVEVACTVFVRNTAFIKSKEGVKK